MDEICFHIFSVIVLALNCMISKKVKIKKTNFIVLILPLIFCAVLTVGANAQRTKSKVRLGKICGNPQLKCRTADYNFQAHEIPFEIPSNDAVIVQSEMFYMIVLKSVKPASDADCENIFSERERLEIQELFPDHKVFALKCLGAGDLYYDNITDGINFIAVYAGKTLTEAKAFLETVKATEKFKGANIRRTQANINGT